MQRNEKKIPVGLLTNAENAVKWQKELDKLEQIENPDGNMEYDIEQLRQKIDRADAFVREFIKNADDVQLFDIQQIAQMRKDELMTNGELDALDKGAVFSQEKVRSSFEYQGAGEMEKKAHFELQRRINLDK